MLPDFLIIGAQKCGTTSLYNHLIQHPDVGCAFEKEVRYFNDHYEDGVNWYKAHFPVTWPGRKLITGEGEPSYLCCPIAPERIFELIPNVKLIVMLRNPVDRAFSHYQHRFTRNRESRTFEEVVAADKEVLQSGWDAMPTGDYKHLGRLHYSYLPRGFYADQLEDWLDVFPRDQLLVIRAEDFFAQTQEIYNEILVFLDLPGRQLPTKKKYFAGKYTEAMSPAMREDLAAYFAPQNKRLAQLLQRDFAWDA